MENTQKETLIIKVDKEKLAEIKLALHDLSIDYLGATYSPNGANGLRIILNCFRPVLQKELKDSI